MSLSPLLLCYDIRDKKRLVRVHRCVKKHGLPLQYSVFYLEMNNAQISSLLRDLDNIIDSRVDDVRVYTISRFNDIQMVGASLMPEGIQIFSQGRPLL
jgi:CRISPR-associated protein Cas2